MLNLVGVQVSGKVNTVLAIAMTLVVVVVLAYGIRYIALVVRPIGGQFLLPFYDPATFEPSLFLKTYCFFVLS